MLDEPLETPSRPFDAMTAPDETGDGKVRNDTTADDVQALAITLATVLAKKPRRSAQPAVGTAAEDDGTQTETAIVSPAARRAYVSALRNQPSSVPLHADDPAHDDDDDEAVAPAGAASWFAGSRRRTLHRHLKAAGAWVATVAIGTAIVAVVAILLFGGPRNLEAWLDFAYRTL